MPDVRAGIEYFDKAKDRGESYLEKDPNFQLVFKKIG